MLDFVGKFIENFHRVNNEQTTFDELLTFCLLSFAFDFLFMKYEQEEILPCVV